MENQNPKALGRHPKMGRMIKIGGYIYFHQLKIFLRLSWVFE